MFQDLIERGNPLLSQTTFKKKKPFLKPKWKRCIKDKKLFKQSEILILLFLFGKDF